MSKTTTGDTGDDDYQWSIPIYVDKVSSGQHGQNNSFPYHEDFARNIEHALIVNDFYEHEAPLINLPFVVKITLAILMTTTLLVGSYFKFVLYKCVFITNKQNRGWMNRPINVLIVASAIIHHITHLSTGIYYILCLTMYTPLGDVFGSWYCHTAGYIAVYGVSYLGVGSLGIAIYRFLYIQFNYWVKYRVGEKIFMWIVLILSVAMSGLLTFSYMLEQRSHDPGLNMCTGLSAKQTQILIDYNDSRGVQMLATTVYQTTAAAICLAFQAIEFTIYIWFFYYRYKQDNGNIANLLNQKVVRDRNVKNVTTFIGQMYVFLAECVFLAALVVFTQLPSEFVHHIRAIVTFIRFSSFGVLSAVEVYTSPELRKTMK